MAALTTTTVRRAAAATAVTSASCAPGRASVALSRDSVSCSSVRPTTTTATSASRAAATAASIASSSVSGAGRATSPTMRVGVGELELGPDQGRPVDVAVEQVRRRREDRLAGDAGHRRDDDRPVDTSPDGDRPGADADDAELEGARALDPAREPDPRHRPRDVVADADQPAGVDDVLRQQHLAVGRDQLGPHARVARHRVGDEAGPRGRRRADLHAACVGNREHLLVLHTSVPGRDDNYGTSKRGDYQFLAFSVEAFQRDRPDLAHCLDKV